MPLGREATLGFTELLKTLVSGALDEALTAALDSCKKRLGSDPIDVEVLLDHLEACLEYVAYLKTDLHLEQWLFRSNNEHARVDLAVQSYKQLRDFTLDQVVKHYRSIDPQDAENLYQPLFNWATASDIQTLPIFTLNYDTAVEEACDAGEKAFIDGIRRRYRREWSPAVFDDYQPQNDSSTLVLFKMHGSVSWLRDSEDRIFETHNQDRDPPGHRHVIQYPSLRAKDLLQEPFKTAYDYFAECLQHSSVLVVVGTSLRDAELTDIIERAFDANPAALAVVMSRSLTVEEAASRLRVPSDRVVAIQARFGDNTGQLLQEVDNLLAGRRKKLGKNVPALKIPRDPTRPPPDTSRRRAATQAATHQR